MAIEFIVVHDEFPNNATNFFNLLDHLFIFGLAVFVQLEESKVIEAPDIQDEVHFVSHSSLHSNDILLINLLMNNLIIDSLNFQWIHLIHLCCDQHRDYPDNMQFCYWKSLILSLEIPVHEVNTSKIGFCCELVR